MAEEIARQGDETLARKAASAVYHSATAVLLACEGARLGAAGGDARRLLMARMVIDHRLTAEDPLSIRDNAFDLAATDCLLDETPVPLDTATQLLTL
jgi:hypothetical protein